MLYFPRGIVHQADVAENEHSMHITLSTYQRNTWGDLMTKLVTGALEIATEEDEDFRQGLPLDYLEYMGVCNSDDVTNKKRQGFSQKISGLLNKLGDYAPVDAAVDQMAIEHVHRCMPPVLHPDETAMSAKGRNMLCGEQGSVEKSFVLDNESEIKLVRPGAARIVVEDGRAHLYHTIDNGLFYEAEPQQFVGFEMVRVCVGLNFFMLDSRRFPPSTKGGGRGI